MYTFAPALSVVLPSYATKFHALSASSLWKMYSASSPIPTSPGAANTSVRSNRRRHVAGDTRISSRFPPAAGW
eukprot:3151-Eustigmatos_ZCMA.PRE.1